MIRSKIRSTYLESKGAIPMVYSDQVFVYTAAADRRKYSHHAGLAYFKGQLYASWSSGYVNEDDIGQGVLFSKSADFFHWSEPEFLVETFPGKDQPAVVTPGGFHTTDDTLVSYFAKYDYDLGEYVRADGQLVQHGRNRRAYEYYAMVSTDGDTFSQPINLNQRQFLPNLGPQKTRSGRLLVCGGPTHLYSDDPSGIGEYKLAYGFKGPLRGVDSDDENYMTFVTEVNGRTVRLCEAAFFQTDDGVIHLLYRIAGTNAPILYESISTDDGETWSEISETQFSDSYAKFHMGRLPDGRFYYVGNPEIVTDETRKRIPLVISISEDGALFDRHFILGNTTYPRRFYGRAKGGVYGYPHSIIAQGCLYVICSICKEDVMVFRVDLNDLKT